MTCLSDPPVCQDRKVITGLCRLLEIGKKLRRGLHPVDVLANHVIIAKIINLGLTLDDMAKVRMRKVAARLEVDFDPVSCVARKRKNLEAIVALSMKNPEIRRNQSELRLSILKIAP